MFQLSSSSSSSSLSPLRLASPSFLLSAAPLSVQKCCPASLEGRNPRVWALPMSIGQAWLLPCHTACAPTAELGVGGLAPPQLKRMWNEISDEEGEDVLCSLHPQMFVSSKRARLHLKSIFHVYWRHWFILRCFVIFNDWIFTKLITDRFLCLTHYYSHNLIRQWNQRS